MIRIVPDDRIRVLTVIDEKVVYTVFEKGSIKKVEFSYEFERASEDFSNVVLFPKNQQELLIQMSRLAYLPLFFDHSLLIEVKGCNLEDLYACIARIDPRGKDRIITSAFDLAKIDSKKIILIGEPWLWGGPKLGESLLELLPLPEGVPRGVKVDVRSNDSRFFEKLMLNRKRVIKEVFKARKALAKDLKIRIEEGKRFIIFITTEEHHSAYYGGGIDVPPLITIGSRDYYFDEDGLITVFLEKLKHELTHLDVDEVDVPFPRNFGLRVGRAELIPDLNQTLDLYFKKSFRGLYSSYPLSTFATLFDFDTPFPDGHFFASLGIERLNKKAPIAKSKYLDFIINAKLRLIPFEYVLASVSWGEKYSFLYQPLGLYDREINPNERKEEVKLRPDYDYSNIDKAKVEGIMGRWHSLGKEPKDVALHVLNELGITGLMGGIFDKYNALSGHLSKSLKELDIENNPLFWRSRYKRNEQELNFLNEVANDLSEALLSSPLAYHAPDGKIYPSQLAYFAAEETLEFLK